MPDDLEDENIQNPDAAPRKHRRGRGIRLANAWRAWAGTEIEPELFNHALNRLLVDDPLDRLEHILPFQRKAECARGDSALQRSMFLSFVERARNDVQLRASREVSDWVKKQRENDNTYDTRRTQDSSEREAWIRLPIAVRFPDPAREDELKTMLPRKVSSEVQLAVVADICEGSFDVPPTEPATWVMFDSNVFARGTSYAPPAAALALWQAVIAGLIERRRFGQQWRYTAVPEAWPLLPDHAWYVDAYRGARAIAAGAEDDEAADEAAGEDAGEPECEARV